MFGGFPTLGGNNDPNKSNNNLGSNSTPIATIGVEKSPEDIPKEELLQLCMKMNKRMQAMETKGKELLKKKNVLLTERQKLLEIVKSVVTLSPSLIVSDENDIDINEIDSCVKAWDKKRKEYLIEMKEKIQHLEAALVNSSNSGNHSATISDNTANDQESIQTTESIEQLLTEAQTKNLKLEAEIEQFRITELNLNSQLHSLELHNESRNRIIDQLTKEIEACKLSYEERVLDLQMQLNSIKSKEDMKEKELLSLRKQIEKSNNQIIALQNVTEEKNMSVNSNKELIQALQMRLVELEPELASCREKIKDLERNLNASVMLKAESDALLSSLRKDLKVSLDDRDELIKKIKELEEYKVKAEGLLLKMNSLTEQVNTLQVGMEDKISLITRLRAEAQASERNHAMRTAMLATCEAQLEALQLELNAKDETTKEALERVTSLQATLSSMEFSFQEKLNEANQQTETVQKKLDDDVSAHIKALVSARKQHEENIESIKRDHAKKSAMARTLLSEREEEVRILSEKVKELQDEITSGAPSERKIFELAQVQARREATHGIHSDTREVAFQQLQKALATKDFDLARSQQSLLELTTEVMELRRTHQRDGINMDYLKNVIIQYMTFPLQSSEKMSLVPVIAMLLQFNAKELAEVQKVNKDPTWGNRPVKEVKRFTVPTPPKLPPSNKNSNTSAKIQSNNNNINHNSNSLSLNANSLKTNNLNGMTRPPSTIAESETESIGQFGNISIYSSSTDINSPSIHVLSDRDVTRGKFFNDSTHNHSNNTSQINSLQRTQTTSDQDFQRKLQSIEEHEILGGGLSSASSAIGYDNESFDEFLGGNNGNHGHVLMSNNPNVISHSI
eukprot:gene5758-7949_t